MRGLNKAESDALAAIALRYGYIATRGPSAKAGAEAGNPIALLLAIISGEVATVLLDQDERWQAIRTLEATGVPILLDIAAQLRSAAERERANEDEDIAEAIEERRNHSTPS